VGTPTILYRLRSVQVPKWYVAERMGGMGRMGTQEEAMKQTEEWWRANLDPNWEKHFTLEKVD
jgi:hypothetical protein